MMPAPFEKFEVVSQEEDGSYMVYCQPPERTGGEQRKFIEDAIREKLERKP